MNTGNPQTIITLGILSGTSVDAIDLALLEWNSTPHSLPKLLACAEHPWERDLKQRLLSLPESPILDLQTLGELHTACGQAFATAANAFCREQHCTPRDITVIGSHGQTVWHHPDGSHPFSLQLGHPAFIAKQTGIPTAGDFRMDDIALGGQGAPLAPALHRLLFARAQEMVVVLNLGGIANVSLLFPDDRVLGFDTGPANTLLDAWYRLHHPDSGYDFDLDGRWATSTAPDLELVSALLAHPFFQQSPPKSTGREDFSLAWLIAELSRLGKRDLPPAVVQSSLLALTVESVAQCLTPLPSGHVWLCGGGVQNHSLVSQLRQRLPHWHFAPTDDAGYASSALEAMLFAYLGYARWQETPIDLACITGQKRPSLLGGLWLP